MARDLFGWALRACARLAGIGGILGASALAHAQAFTIVDDFNRSTDTGWTRIMSHGALNGFWTLLSGRYQIRNFNSINFLDEGAVMSALNISTQTGYQNGTWRVKVRSDNNYTSVRLATRFAGSSETSFRGYFLHCSPNLVDDTSVRLLRIDSGNAKTTLAEVARNNFQFLEDADYWVEFGAVGARVTVRIWRDGLTRPANPQISVLDGTYATGGFSMGGYKSDDPDYGFSPVASLFDDLAFAAGEATETASDVVFYNPLSGAGNLWRLADGTNGPTVLGSDALPTQTDLNWRLVGRGDFNANGTTDLLWRNRSTGGVQAWLMAGASRQSIVPMEGEADLEWEIAAVGDADDDGDPDLAWRNIRTGANRLWLMNGTSRTATVNLPTVADPTWRIQGMADVNLAGPDDIVWVNMITGQIQAWHVLGGAYVGSTVFSVGLSDRGYRLLDITDFTGDGKPDVMWRHVVTGQNVGWALAGGTFLRVIEMQDLPDTRWNNTDRGRFEQRWRQDVDFNRTPDVVWRNTATGQNVLWLMTAGGSPGSVVSLPNVGGAWRVRAFADMNRDSHPDIVWRNPVTGQNAVWALKSGQYVRHHSLPGADLAWDIGGAGDANEDGIMDIYWRNTQTGENTCWLMAGKPGDASPILGLHDIPDLADLSWSLVGVGRINRDDSPDLVWRKSGTGAVTVWFMNGTALAGTLELPAMINSSWSIAKVADLDNDGIDDLWWRNSGTGANLVWRLSPTGQVGTTNLTGVNDLNWKMED